MIEWLSPKALQDFAQPEPGREFTRVLLADLRDPLMLPLLRPAPVTQDFADEKRPGASDRGYFLARRAALRSFVGMIVGCSGDDVRVGYNAEGAPGVLSQQGLFVSVSGRGPVAALAVSSECVGVDLEPLHEACEVITHVLHETERAWLETFSGELASRNFLRLWTAKEACLKALGTGLTNDPAEICIACSGDRFEAEGLPDGFLLREGAFLETSFGPSPAIAACAILRSQRLPAD